MGEQVNEALTAQVIFRVVVPLGVVENSWYLPVYIKLGGFSLPRQKDTRVLDVWDSCWEVPSGKSGSSEDLQLLELYLIYLVDGFDQEVVEQVPLLVRHTLSTNKCGQSFGTDLKKPLDASDAHAPHSPPSSGGRSPLLWYGPPGCHRCGRPASARVSPPDHTQQPPHPPLLGLATN